MRAALLSFERPSQQCSKLLGHNEAPQYNTLPSTSKAARLCLAFGVTVARVYFGGRNIRVTAKLHFPCLTLNDEAQGNLKSKASKAYEGMAKSLEMERTVQWKACHSHLAWEMHKGLFKQ